MKIFKSVLNIVDHRSSLYLTVTNNQTKVPCFSAVYLIRRTNTICLMSLAGVFVQIGARMARNLISTLAHPVYTVRSLILGAEELKHSAL